MVCPDGDHLPGLGCTCGAHESLMRVLNAGGCVPVNREGRRGEFRGGTLSDTL